MAAAAGWYADPGQQPGMMRYWDGTLWTGHLKPFPPPVADAPLPEAVAVGQASDAQTQANPWAPENLLRTAQEAIADPENRATGTAAAGGALIADGIVGFGKNRDGIGGAVKAILFGIVWIFATNLILNPIMASNKVQEGETTTQGTVTQLRWGSGDDVDMCSPIAEFSVDGQIHTARYKARVSPCPWNEGDTVDVIYHPDRVANTARVQDDSGMMTMFPLIFTGAGVLIIVGGIWTFIKRAGSIAAGIYLLKSGMEKRRGLKNGR